MNTRTKLAIAASAAMWMVPITNAVAGIDVTAGDWKIDFAGNVNAFYVGTKCQDPSSTTTVVGGLTCVSNDRSSSIRNGLLPAALVFSATSRQADLDIDVTIGFYPGINSDLGGGAVNGTGNPSALQSPGIDARQVYFTFGDASWGTVKMGRDIGLFGKDAILDDMTLLGVGTALGNPAPSNTSLGRIGIGYIYTDWEPQITYTTANLSGFTGSFGVFQPLNDGVYNSHNSPQFQVGAAFAFGDPKSDALSGKVWVDVVSQKLKLPSSVHAGPGPSHELHGHRGRRRRQAGCRRLRGRAVRLYGQGRRHDGLVHFVDIGIGRQAQVRRRLPAGNLQIRQAESRPQLWNFRSQARRR